MSLLRRIFWRKPDRLLEVSDRVYVFDCSFSEEPPKEAGFLEYFCRPVAQLRELFPCSSLLAFHVGEEHADAPEALRRLDVPVEPLPRLFAGCPVLPMAAIGDFLGSAEGWLKQQNILLLLCEPRGWPTLAFSLAALLLYRKQYSGEQKALDAVYAHEPRMMRSCCPVDPRPSHLRFLHYVCTSGTVSQWPLEGAPVVLDCMTFRDFPDLGGRGIAIGVCGRDPSNRAAMYPMALTTVEKHTGEMGGNGKGEGFFEVRIDCRVQGDVVLECFHMDYNPKSENTIIFSLMFNTTFIPSDSLILSREKIDIEWAAKDRFSKDFRAEVMILRSPKQQEAADSPPKSEAFFETSTSFGDIHSNDGTNVYGEAEPGPAGIVAGLENISLQSDSCGESGGHDETRRSPEEAIAATPVSKRQPESPRNHKEEKPKAIVLEPISPRVRSRLGSSDEYSGDTVVPLQNKSSSLPPPRPPAAPIAPPQQPSPLPAAASAPPPKPTGIMLPKPAPPPPSSPPKPSGIMLPKLTPPPPAVASAPPPKPSGIMLPKLTPPPPPAAASAPPPKPSGNMLPKPAPPPPPPPRAPSKPAPPPPPPMSKQPPPRPPPPRPGGKDPPAAAFPPSKPGPTAAAAVIIPGTTPGLPPPAPPRAPSRSPSNSRARSRPRSASPMKLAPRRVALKPLHWTKLSRAAQGSIWADLQQHDDPSGTSEFDMSEIEALFAANVAKSSISPFGRTKAHRKGPKINKVHLVDNRRANNCEIMLTKIKMPLPDMMNAILAMDDSILGLDQVENLAKFCPTKEEMELLKNYTGDKTNLGKCELFFLELMKVPRIEAKLKVFLFKIQFYSQISDLRKNLCVIRSACHEIRNSAKLKEILKIILVIGNTLNQGTARGSALGFRLDSLLKLTEMRESNSKTTLMHYLCKKLAAKSPHLLDFYVDLVNLEGASKIQLKYLAEETQAIYTGLDKVKAEMEASTIDGLVSSYFRKVLGDFIVAAEAEVQSLISLYKEVGRTIDALALYFGEDPTRFSFEQGMGTLLNFIRMFQSANLENNKMAEIERKRVKDMGSKK